MRPLRYGKLVGHLVAGLVAFAALPAGLPDEADGEASFPVYKTNNPAKLNQPFLLIVRTQHVVTHLSAGSVGYSGFPAYGRIACSTIAGGRGNDCYLRTVIVTAAVYRSFGCELHPLRG